MKNYTIAVLVCLLFGSCRNISNKALSETEAISEMENPQTKLTLVSETTDLPRLEPVIFVKKRNVLYDVSIQDGQEPGDGSIAMLSATGKMLNPINLQSDIRLILRDTEKKDISLFKI